MSCDELVDIVDEEGRFINTVTRRERDEFMLRSKVSRIIIYGTSGNLLVHKRAKTVRMYKSYFDIGIAETLKSGECFHEGAIRGLYEEYDIKVDRSEIISLFLMPYDNQVISRLYQVYSLHWDGEPKKDPQEIESVFRISIDNLEQMIKTYKFYPAAPIIFEKAMKEYPGLIPHE